MSDVLDTIANAPALDIVEQHAQNDQCLLQQAASVDWKHKAELAFNDLTREKTGGINAALVAVVNLAGGGGGIALFAQGTTAGGITGVAEIAGGIAVGLGAASALAYTVSHAGPDENIIVWKKKRNLQRRKTRLTRAMALTAKAEVEDNGDVIAVVVNHGKKVQSINLGRQNQDVIAQRFMNIQRFCTEISEQQNQQRQQSLLEAGITPEGRLLSAHQKLLDDGKTTEAMARSANQQLARNLNR